MRPSFLFFEVFLDNLGTMRIDRSSIVFLDEEQTGGDTIITFNETCFEGPTAPAGYVDAMRINGICFFYYAHSENANGKGLCIYMVVGKLKCGICGRFCKPHIKNYLIGSTIAAAVEWGIIYLTGFLQGWTEGIFEDALLFSGVTFALCFVVAALIGHIFKKRRQKLDSGTVYQELAQTVGVTVQTLKAIEDGSYNPSIKLCREICKATNRTLDELFWKNEINLPKEPKV